MVDVTAKQMGKMAMVGQKGDSSTPLNGNLGSDEGTLGNSFTKQNFTSLIRSMEVQAKNPGEAMDVSVDLK